MNIRKKQTVTSPARYMVKDAHHSPRNAVQEVIISDTSIGNNIEEVNHRQTAKFYSPQYRKEVGGSTFQKNKSPQTSRNSLARGADKKLSSGQQQLTQLEKARRNVTRTSIAQKGSKQSQNKYKSNPGYGNPRQSAVNIDLNVVQTTLPPPQANNTPSSPRRTPHQSQPYEPYQPEPYPIYEQKSHLQSTHKLQTKEFQYVFPNGDRYNGTWSGKYIEGSGIYDFTKQNLQYRGQFKASKQHGRGTLLRKPTGHMQREDIIYEGQWMNGYKEGFGKYYYYKDTYYQGNWVKNSKEGLGTFKSPEGEFVGEWKNDKKHGIGTLQLSNGSNLKGTWENDEFLNGNVVYSNGDRYDGQLVRSERQGFGTYNYTNNNTEYRGRWHGNNKNGAANVQYLNGDIFEGTMNHNRRQGGGTYEWKNTGDIVKGNFVNDWPVAGHIFVNKDNKQYQFALD